MNELRTGSELATADEALLAAAEATGINANSKGDGGFVNCDGYTANDSFKDGTLVGLNPCWEEEADCAIPSSREKALAEWWIERAAPRRVAVRKAALYLALVLACASPGRAIKPLVSGDVPTADKGVYEVFVGYLVTEDGDTTAHEVPFWEVVYGLTQSCRLVPESVNSVA